MTEEFGPYCLLALCTLEGEPSNYIAPFKTVEGAIEFFNEHFEGPYMEYRIFRYSSPEDWKQEERQQ